jgi:hypothetical protein
MKRLGKGLGSRGWGRSIAAFLLIAGAGAAAWAQEKPAYRISAAEAKDLFGMVDELTRFSSEESGLPVKSAVKRKIVSRAEVEGYLREKFEEDESARRLQQSEIVLKKFGLLDRDFALKPFLLELLKEQVEAYYDEKTKTISLLDWVAPEEQRAVLAHELTHALQDQQVDLEKWASQSPETVSLNAAQDGDHIQRDEMDTARAAVLEGQATAVMIDYALMPMGKSLAGDPETANMLKQQIGNASDSPVMARAPLMLTESMLFPYSAGLDFEQTLWVDRGREAAFLGALQRPPRSSWEVMNPSAYEQKLPPPVPLLPNIHPLVDKLYRPYDLGQMGQLDLHILAGVFGGDAAARRLTPAWRGGLYWAGQRLDAKSEADRASTKSIALFYFSEWKSAGAAQAFAALYGAALGRQFSGLKRDAAAERAHADEQVYQSAEGPILIAVRGKSVFVAESFELPLARKLEEMLVAAQGAGESRLAEAVPGRSPAAGLVRIFAECGAMKAVVRGAAR